jgi:Outer membrane protein beta-barrel domain
MTKTRLVLTIALLCGVPAVSQAQPVEVGVGIGTGAANALSSDFGGIYSARGLGFETRVTLPVNERFAIQPFVTYARWSEASYRGPGVSGGRADQTAALFGAVVEQRFPMPRPSLRLFMTYGIAAGYERQVVASAVYTGGGKPQTIPGYTSEHFAEIPISLFGGGVQQAIGRHFAIRAEAQALGLFIIPLGVRASVGVAVPLGK